MDYYVSKEFFSLFDIPFIDGNGVLHKNARNIALNIVLTLYGIRPAFLIQEADYKDPDVLVRIFNITNAVKEFEHYYIEDQGGFLFFLKTSNKTIRLLVKYLQSKGDESHLIFGKILGYPCAGELVKMERKTIMNIVVDDGLDVMSNVCTQESSIREFRRKFYEIEYFVERHRLPVKVHMAYRIL